MSLVTLKRLLDAAEPALARGPVARERLGQASPQRRDELEQLLVERNGFYAFDRALHVFPASIQCDGHDAGAWNDEGLWRAAYGGMADGLFFFAENVFGDQFAVRDDAVVYFDAETGSTEFVANTINEWCAHVLVDQAGLGAGAARAWSEAHGPIAHGERLFAIKLFVMGGDASIENLREIDAVEGMRVRGDIAQQIAKLPDGAVIELVTGGEET